MQTVTTAEIQAQRHCRIIRANLIVAQTDKSMNSLKLAVDGEALLSE